MKEKKRDVKGWIAIGLAVLSLFLVIFGPTLKKQYEEAKEKQAAAEAKKKRQEKEQKEQEWFESLCSPEEGWTVADYDRAIKGVILADLDRNEYTTVFGIKKGGTVEELSFYDCYVTSDNYRTHNKENNRGYDFVLRYIYNNYDGEDGVGHVTAYFTMNDIYGDFRDVDRYECGDDVTLFTDYLVSNRKWIKYEWFFVNMSETPSDELSYGSLAYFSAEDFADLSSYVPNAE